VAILLRGATADAVNLLRLVALASTLPPEIRAEIPVEPLVVRLEVRF
jgi:hypothetical protein